MQALWFINHAKVEENSRIKNYRHDYNDLLCIPQLYVLQTVEHLGR